MGFWDSLPSVSNIVYTSVKNSGNTTITLPTVITSPRKRVEGQPSYGVYRKWRTTFKIDYNVWLAAAGIGTYPKLRDTLSVAGNLWTVCKDVDAPADMLPRGLWRLCCIRLEIVPDLADTIAITLPRDSTDEYLSPLTTTESSTNYICRIQSQQNKLEDYQGIQFLRQYFKVYVQDLNLDLPVGTVFTPTTGEYIGQVFRVLDNQYAENLEELETLTATIDPI